MNLSRRNSGVYKNKIKKQKKTHPPKKNYEMYEMQNVDVCSLVIKELSAIRFKLTITEVVN